MDANHQDGTPHLYLKPGELCISQRAVLITTVLGSCVSATLFHRPSGLAAICHAMQPYCPQHMDCSSACRTKFRYAPCVISEMARRMAEYGIRPKELEVKLFGGSTLIGRPAEEVESFSAGTSKSIGQQNVQSAMESLIDEGFIIKVTDVGGTSGRKILFDTRTGTVMVKRIRRSIQQQAVT